MKISKIYKERFKTKFKVNKKGCWIWGAGRFPYGYGAFHMGTRKKGRTQQAHIVSYRIYKGPVRNKSVLHKCNTPPCVNPQHLYLGTQLQNMADRKKAGNFMVGSKHCNSRYTEKIMRKIKKEYSGKFGEVRKLSKKYGVGYPTVWNVVNNITWKHV